MSLLDLDDMSYNLNQSRKFLREKSIYNIKLINNSSSFFFLNKTLETNFINFLLQKQYTQTYRLLIRTKIAKLTSSLTSFIVFFF